MQVHWRAREKQQEFGRPRVPGLEPERAEAGMVVGATAEQPMKLSLGLADRHIVDARDPFAAIRPVASNSQFSFP